MKKCPECGNPNYDGAPECGNCGFKFPKSNVTARRGESIFQTDSNAERRLNEESTIDILKENSILIGTIILITLIVICGIVITGLNSENDQMGSGESIKYNVGDFSFEYPMIWSMVNESDSQHPTAIFFKNNEDVVIEFYNTSTQSENLKEINQQRISYAQSEGSYVELVETIKLDGRNSSNIILENADGNYTRYVSMFSDGELYVFKISGDSVNSVTSQDIDTMIHSADIK